MKIIVTIIMLGFAFTLAGCDTMKGLGSDIQKAGKAIEKKAGQ